MGEIARKAAEELRRSAETPSPSLRYLLETREDFNRRFEQELREVIPGFDPVAEGRRRRRLNPLKRRPVDWEQYRSANAPEDLPSKD
jgi:hypothetical protein